MSPHHIKTFEIPFINFYDSPVSSATYLVRMLDNINIVCSVFVDGDVY